MSRFSCLCVERNIQPAFLPPSGGKEVLGLGGGEGGEGVGGMKEGAYLGRILIISCTV